MGLKISLTICLLTMYCGYISANNVSEKVSMFPRNPINSNEIVPLIVGGTQATAGEFRGKISIQYTNGTHICGGTLIHERHILTSASCMLTIWGEVINPSEFRLMGDDLTISVVSGNPSRQMRSATHIFVHPEFNMATFDNNIAVIRTNVSYIVSPTFNPVLRSDDSPPINTQCSVAGWGAIRYNGPISFQLMRINVGVISRALCNSPASYNGLVRGGMFCAGIMAGGVDACQGDGGGGLICNGIIYGIVSWGLECGLADFPGVYTDVAIYNVWIGSAISWNEGGHENIPTPTPITTETPVPTPPGNSAGVVLTPIYLFFMSFSVLLKRLY